ncbi:hypothetical protein COHA_003491 [Chlorella ohadii]|uniref:Peptidase M11 gametolysin domain-containing protein n=1 Tax=Chlorella ohadii TaxID=2649997 RepID=A0AAD5DUX3_9CHLO|nr:hypothetical protein COHA_003491 [Chlorella ohadii]
MQALLFVLLAHWAVAGLALRPLEPVALTGEAIVLVGDLPSSILGSRPPTFKASTIKTTQQLPVPAARPLVAAAATAANGTARPAAAAAMLPTISNPLVLGELSALFVPISATDATGLACSGTSFSFVSVDEVKAAIFGGPWTPDRSLAATLNSCSHGRSRLTPQNSLVTDLVTLPCGGYGGQVPWNWDDCSFYNWMAMSDNVDAILRSRGIDVNRYKFRFYLMPRLYSGCGYEGLGYQGLDGYGIARNWVGGYSWTSPQVYLHELGHNLQVGHASGPSAAIPGTIDEYGDDSCAMGSCCFNRCFNTPHAFQLGWISAQQRAALAPGQSVSLQLPSQSVSAAGSALRVVPTWAPGVPDLWLGYRTKAGGDAELFDAFAGKLSAYTLQPATDFSHPQASLLLATLPAGKGWAWQPAGLSVCMHSATSQYALVTLCRPAAGQACACTVEVAPSIRIVVATPRKKMRRPYTARRAAPTRT